MDSITVLKQAEEEIAKCMKCGNCMAVCPIYKETKSEAGVARGKIQLGLKLGSRLQNIFLRDIGPGTKSPRLPLGLETKRVLPALALVPFRDAYVPVPLAHPQLKVAFFTGCVTNYIYTEVGKATVEVLRANNIEVIVPREQHCCGAPVRIHGDLVTAEAMARSQVHIFAKLPVDAIITVCGTCGEAFQHSYPELLAQDPVYRPLAEKIAAKTHDITEFLINVLKINPAALPGVNLKVTYHHPCHLARGMGVSQEPLQLLRAIPGLTFTEMNNSARCCGGAGSFSLTHYQLSMEINRHKAANIQATGADLVVTGCGSCRMQLEEGLRLHGTPKPIRHTIEVLAQAYAGQTDGIPS